MFTRAHLVVIFLSFFAFPFSSASAAPDVFSFSRIAQVVASPDGKTVAFISVRILSGTSGKKREYSLYVREGEGTVRLLDHAEEMSFLQWKKDGTTLGYLVKNGHSTILRTADLRNHRTNKIFALDRPILSFKWAPDGESVAFTAEEPEEKSTLLLPIDVSTHYTPVRLYLLSLKGKNSAPLALTPRTYSISQFFVFPGFDWSPDGKKIVFSYQPRPEARYAEHSKIALIDVASRAIHTLPYTQNYTSSQPIFSPDGQSIAFHASLFPRTSSLGSSKDLGMHGHVCLYNLRSAATHCLSNSFNETPIVLGWNNTSSQVFVLDVFKSLGYEIYALDKDPSLPATNISHMRGFIEPLTVSLNSTGTVFGFGYETPHTAPEAMIAQANAFQLKQVSHLNAPASPLGESQVIHWQSFDGKEIEGILTTPPGFDPSKKYPLLVTAHGGPAGAWALRYLGGCDEYGTWIDPTTCWPHSLDLGFVVFAPNPRGSTGYGRAFHLANFADFGGGDYRDIMTGIDHLIQQGIADKDRMAIAGWSFGGYMTAWAISQTDRFKAAIMGNGNTNFISFTGTSDIPDYYTRYLGTDFWENDQLYRERAPISHVKNIKTPLLILASENDIRVPPTQSYELYSALERQQKPVKMLMLPKQGHVPTDPTITDACIKEVNAWLTRALR